MDHNLHVQVYNGSGVQITNNALVIAGGSGYVGIGTPSPDATLAVKGTVHAQEVKVDLNVPGPDYVFDRAYSLRPLSELRNYIQANGRLPEVPSALTMAKEGLKLGEMNTLLLKKVEELTLYLLEKDRQYDALRNALTRNRTAQQKQIALLTKQLAALKKPD